MVQLFLSANEKVHDFEGQDGDIYFTQNDCFDGTYDFYIIVCNRTDKPDKREECREK